MTTATNDDKPSKGTTAGVNLWNLAGAAMLFFGALFYVEYRLDSTREPFVGIIHLDATQVSEAMEQAEGKRPSARRVAERVYAISEHYAQQGYVVLDRNVLLAWPPESEINVQP